MYQPHELALELKIRAAERQFQKQPTRDNWFHFCRLVGQRSPGRVADMEREKFGRSFA